MTKRILSLAFASLALTGQILAQPDQPRCIVPAQKAPSRAAETSVNKTEFGYCGDMKQALSLSGKAGAAMQINAAIARKYAGAQVTAVLVANGTTNQTKAATLDIDVFCSATLDGTPTATASG
ncbi:MAG: hypothetical protein K2G59_07430, partial [Muribaculaceae bacterium]|nr:hypothetical protein [Muribaculaceae bacterium]